MAIQKTGVKYTAGGVTKTVEVSGQQPMVRLTSLDSNTRYRVTPYVVDSGWGEVTGGAVQLDTLPPSEIVMYNQTEYDGRTADVSFSFDSAYEIVDAVVFNDDSRDFDNADEYTPVIVQEDVGSKWSGDIKLQVNDPRQWFVLRATDIYGEMVEDVFDINDFLT